MCDGRKDRGGLMPDVCVSFFFYFLFFKFGFKFQYSFKISTQTKCTIQRNNRHDAGLYFVFRYFIHLVNAYKYAIHAQSFILRT